MALLSALCSMAFNADAAVVQKTSGATTPTLSDFNSNFSNHPNKVGYNHGGTDGMFIETFRAPCEKGQVVTKAVFTIKVQKLSQGRDRGDNDALAFWDNGTPQFNTYLWSAADPVGAVKTLSFNIANLAPAPGVINSPPGNNGMGLLSDFDFSFSVQDDTSVLEATLDYSCGAPEKKGLTWGLYPADNVTGTATVSCMGAPGPACNPIAGDTPGTAMLPVLCFKALNLPYPAQHQTASASSDASYWSGGLIATTAPVSPVAQNWVGTGKAPVDAYCVAQFGPGWEVAEHHMGQGKGWKFGAYGNVGKPATQRFWVHINNQPNGNVW
jgi:hypothetical protein